MTEPKDAPYATTGEKKGGSYSDYDSESDHSLVLEPLRTARSKMVKAVVGKFVKKYTSQPKLQKKYINYQERVNENITVN